MQGLADLSTIPRDVFALFDQESHHEVSEENLTAFAENTKQLLRERLSLREASTSPLRFSALGKPDRQIWYEAHPDGSKERFRGQTLLKFLYGDLIEQLLLFLIKEAGHSVEQEQAEVSVNGVKGHIDAIIDGVVVDIKSASPYGYKKFEDNSVIQEDPFGYVDQLAGYASVLTPGEPAAWIANDKVGGDICVSMLPQSVIRHYHPEPRIEHLKEVIKSDVIPERCYEPVPDGASGNLKLPTPCGYCSHKFRCHPDVRTFLYSTGPRYLTTVKLLPKVMEV